ncbi:MAG: hypothetical protein M3443_00715 [Actinomycetota bacterium]|nr:hypothetical protein [Actinomycetota bacterium]
MNPVAPLEGAAGRGIDLDGRSRFVSPRRTDIDARFPGPLAAVLADRL